MSSLGYSRVGNIVTLTMIVEDYQRLLFCLGSAAGAAHNQGMEGVFLARLALMNRLSEGNPDLTPYELADKWEMEPDAPKRR